MSKQIERPEDMAERMHGSFETERDDAARTIVARDAQIIAWCEEQAEREREAVPRHEESLNNANDDVSREVHHSAIDRCEGAADAYLAVVAALKASHLTVYPLGREWQCPDCGKRYRTLNPEGQWCAEGHQARLVVAVDDSADTRLTTASGAEYERDAREVTESAHAEQPVCVICNCLIGDEQPTERAGTVHAGCDPLTRAAIRLREAKARFRRYDDTRDGRTTMQRDVIENARDAVCDAVLDLPFDRAEYDRFVAEMDARED